MRYPHTSEWLSSRSLEIINAREGMEKSEPSYTVGGTQSLWRTVLRFLKKLKIDLPYDPAIPLLGIYPEKTPTGKDTCTTEFIAAVCTIAKTRKQPKCPSTDEGIKKMWYIYIYIHTMEYHSAIKIMN